MSWFANLKITTKFIVILCVMFVTLMGVNAVDDYLRQESLIVKDATDNARILARQIVETREYMSSVVRGEPEANYNLVPQVVATQVAKRITTGSKYYVRQVSLRYRNPANRPDAYETAMLQRFGREKAAEQWEVVTIGGKRVFRYLLPMTADASCLGCHGRYEEAPAFVRARFPKGHPSYDYRIGQLIGAVSVSIPMAELYRQIGINLKLDLAVVSGVVLLILAAMSFMVHRSIIRPVRSVATSIGNVAATGNFSERLRRSSNDEVGELVGAFNELMEELDRTTRQRQESEDRYRNVLEMAQSAIVTFLADGKLIIANRKAEDLFGLPKGELLGVSIYTFMEEGDAVKGAIETYLREGAAAMIGETTPQRIRSIRGNVTTVEMALSVSRSDHNPLFTAILRENSRY